MNNLPALEDLRLFCAVVRNMSFVATAREFGASPAFVSKRIAFLEDILNVRLLHRTTRRVNLTEDGATVYRWGQQILEDVEQMTESVTAAKSIPRGPLRISSSPGFGRKHLAPALSELATRYPSLQIYLEMLDRPVDLIGEGFDIDIRIGTVSEPNLMVKKLATNTRVLCAAPSYLARRGVPTKLSELENHDCIVIRERDQSFGVWKLEGTKGMESVRVKGPLSCNNGEVVHQWVLDGHGIALRSIWDVNGSLRDGLLVRVLPEYHQDAQISAVYPLRLRESAKVRVCVEFLKDRLCNQFPLVQKVEIN
ncbi:MAG: LysR family transcriptional regulator [Oryzomonas sp.]|uniref:LysR family transcriptional regulator n=1 Tax=Oryzomonas sp. TaxID=2855186 RepID=UPI00283E75D8|nr:LysR family transcriptional regulator [Oryzomonas sp.]MDR3580494.1 LysR family transcriptional regulator [Oryzomonas sp.]